MPVYVGTGESSGKILKLFHQDVVKGGYVIGVVSKDATVLYDMTDRYSAYKNAGSSTTWDNKFYDTTSGTNSCTGYIELSGSGLSLFSDSIKSGKYYVSQKSKEDSTTEQYLHNTTNSTYTEVAAVSNVTVYTYYTNKTVIVDPYFQNLNSVLKFEYPKVITEGDYLLYKLTRSGSLFDALTVHLITNGHLCANVRWEANEGGTKSVRVKTGVNDTLDDNFPLEVVVKTLNRRVTTE